jgi:hypothetical protein
MALNIANWLADFNGNNFIRAGTAEFGYVPTSWFIALNARLAALLPANLTLGNDPFPNAADKTEFLKANFRHVRPNCQSDEEALCVASLRLSLASKGVLCLSLNNQGRSVIDDEYVVINHLGANWADPLNDIPGVASAPAIAKFFKRYGPTIAHMAAYVFCARGHHWTPDYAALYDRLMKASLIPDQNGFVMPSKEVLFRFALHGFAVKPLYDMAMADRNAGLMVAAVSLRFTPHPPIAGVAHITTLHAILGEMSKESWWNDFVTKFQNPINDINGELALINANPLSYHVASFVIGGVGRTLTSAAAEQAFNLLCQLAIGFVDHLGRRHPMSGQIAVTKKSGGPRGLADAFAKACDTYGKPSLSGPDMASFLAQL